LDGREIRKKELIWKLIDAMGLAVVTLPSFTPILRPFCPHVKFSDLTDEQWKLIEPHLPPPARTGRPRNDDDRITINGIIYVLTTGCRRWMGMPDRYGPHKSVWEREAQELERGRYVEAAHGRAGGEGRVLR
jgi:Putative transposase of IS4/5 family (DUF4096)